MGLRQFLESGSGFAGEITNTNSRNARFDESEQDLKLGVLSAFVGGIYCCLPGYQVVSVMLGLIF